MGIQQALAESTLPRGSTLKRGEGRRNSTGGRSWARVGIGSGGTWARGGRSRDLQGDTSIRRDDLCKVQSGPSSSPPTLKGVGDRDGRQPPAPPDRINEQSRQAPFRDPKRQRTHSICNAEHPPRGDALDRVDSRSRQEVRDEYREIEAVSPPEGIGRPGEDGIGANYAVESCPMKSAARTNGVFGGRGERQAAVSSGGDHH